MRGSAELTTKIPHSENNRVGYFYYFLFDFFTGECLQVYIPEIHDIHHSL
jgi:hypothetical protein